MRDRPTLTTTTAQSLFDQVREIEQNEKRTRASVVEELLAMGLAARGKVLARIRRVSGRGHARNSTARGAK